MVAFHLGVPFFSAGFLGVDVFFVLSGFLIVRLLLEERGRTNTIKLAAFWGRRVRRLLPAATVVIIVSLCGALFVFPLELEGVGRSGLYTALYGANEYYLEYGGGYWQNRNVSVFLHAWSLSVEEQFYLVTPILLFVVARSRRWLTVAGVVLAIAFAASIYVCVHAPTISAKQEQTLFFMPWFRAWEFLGGALIAVLDVGGLAKTTSKRAHQAAAAAALLGLVLMAASLVASTRASDHFPWPGSLGAVFGTVLLVGAGCVSTKTAAARVLSTWPFAVVGRLSYSIYLLHWPLLLFSDALFTATRIAHLGVAVLSVTGALAMNVVVERPVRFHPKLSASPWRSLLLGAALVGVSCLCAAGVRTAAKSPSFGAKPALTKLTAETNDFQETGRCAVHSLSALKSSCMWGPKDATDFVLLVGDSHAMEWLPAFRGAANDTHVKIVLATAEACPGFGVPIRLPHSHVKNEGCDAWQKWLPTLMQQLRPRLVVAAQSSEYLDDDRVYAKDAAAARKLWDDGLVAFAHAARSSGATFALWLDMPPLPRAAADCVALFSAEKCAAHEDAIARLKTLERHELDLLGDDVLFVDPKPVLCPTGICAAADAKGLLYTDTNHLRQATASRMRSAATDLVSRSFVR